MRRVALLICASTLACSGFAWAQSAPAPNGMKERVNLRNVRYCEFFVVKRKGLSASASVYNTLGLNDCPQEQWRRWIQSSCKRSSTARAWY